MIYKVITNLKHNGTYYPAGAKLEAEVAEVAVLVRDGVVAPAETKAGAKPTTNNTPAPKVTTNEPNTDKPTTSDNTPAPDTTDAGDKKNADDTDDGKDL